VPKSLRRLRAEDKEALQQRVSIFQTLAAAHSLRKLLGTWPPRGALCR